MAEVSTVQQLPAPFIEAAGKTYLADLQSAIGGLKGADLSKVLGPQFVAPTSQITQEAQALRGGLGSFAPFLQTAAASTGPQAYQQFMSPYQQDVISETLREFDVQAQKGIPSIAAQAVSRGVLGGGREGVVRSEYQTTSDRNRAALQAQLLQQGFGQAQQLAQQNFANQMGLAQAAPQLFGQQISALGALGTQQQAQQQAQLGAQQQLLQAQQNQPLNLAQQLGQGVMGLISGYPAQFQTQQTPTPSPLQTALGAGATLAGVYRAFS
tara:strand:+ start:52 stop:855 length:804 start_codon:yes stop_codon:yes gene_type:complete